MKILGLEKIKNLELQNHIEQLCAKAIELNVYNTDVFSVIPNPSGIHPAFDIYPLAKTPTTSIPAISAILTDMDGTTTTTEVLCLHAQEYMIQQITSSNGVPAVPLLSPEKDYPHIIGNSTTKHIEYLLATYGEFINETSLLKNYVYAALWTLIYSPDAGRKSDVSQTLRFLGLEKAVVVAANAFSQQQELMDYATKLYSSLPSLSLTTSETSIRVRMAIDIYYQRYHGILKEISEGKSDALAKQLTGGRRLIEPMKGIALFLSVLKGALGEELGNVLPANDPAILAMSNYFVTNPAKIALVTSSIYYEADIVLAEVFKVLQQEVAGWNISKLRKKTIIELFNDYHNVYDAIVTATDSHEIRLKPHRDLYSIGLYKLGIPTHEFPNALGFEDSESGLMAIRAAGVGRAIGIPFEATKGHNLQAASTILTGGLLDILTIYHFFLKLPSH